jgi:hypothetical protein
LLKAIAIGLGIGLGMGITAIPDAYDYPLDMAVCRIWPRAYRGYAGGGRYRPQIPREPAMAAVAPVTSQPLNAAKTDACVKKEPSRLPLFRGRNPYQGVFDGHEG